MYLVKLIFVFVHFLSLDIIPGDELTFELLNNIISRLVIPSPGKQKYYAPVVGYAMPNSVN